MNDDWTKDIQHLMSDYEAKAPDGLLDDIKKEMARRGDFAHVSSKASTEETVEAKPVQKGRVVPLWRYRWIAAAAVAIIAVPVVYKLLPETKQQIAEVAKKAETVSQHQLHDNAMQERSWSSTGAGDIALSGASGNATLHGAYGNTVSLGSDSPCIVDVIQSSDVTNAETSDTSDSEKHSDNSESAKTPPKRQFRTYRDTPTDYSFDYTTEKRSSRGMTLTAYYGGSTGSGSTAAMSGGYLAMADFSNAEPIGVYPLEMAGANSKGFLDESQPKRKAHHKQPIKVGMSVGYRLNDRWSVNTGVTYSYLSSDFTAENQPTEAQKLHYVGIPVTASYSILKSRKAEVYVTGGGEVEKLVKGTKSYENYDDEKVKEKRPQWSVKAAVGGAYHFTPTLSVYAEPGVSYHFDNHSTVDNVYKDRKTSFSLNIGLRVNLSK